jgi:hypothetical protein
LFTHFTNDPLTDSLPLLQSNLLLIYNLIPTELTYFFYNYIGRQQTHNTIFITFITDLMQDINYNIWHEHHKSNLQWELNLNITPKRKRNYRKQHRNDQSNSLSSLDPTNTNNLRMEQDIYHSPRHRK